MNALAMEGTAASSSSLSMAEIKESTRVADSLWIEKYRPTDMDDYVWRDPALRTKIEELLRDGVLPHLILAGRPGTGKTSLAKLLLRELGVPRPDILQINASKYRNIADMESKIAAFLSTWPMTPNGVKYVVLDEADTMSRLAQKFLRDEVESNSSMARFIFTCNEPEKIHEAIHSRSQVYNFDQLDRDEFVMRVASILLSEEVTFEEAALFAHVESAYPDLRKCIGSIQQATVGKVLGMPKASDAKGTKDYMLEAAIHFASGDIRQGREVIIASARVEEYPSIYTFLYRNLSLWGDTQKQQDDALLIIRKALVWHDQVADVEINLSACLVELSRI